MSLLRRGLEALRHPVSQNALALHLVQLGNLVVPLVTLPYISRVLAEQHTRDLQNEATQAHRARQARLVQPSIEDTQCGAGCWRLR